MSYKWFPRSNFVSVEDTVHIGSAGTARRGLEKIRREYAARIVEIDAILETSGPEDAEVLAEREIAEAQSLIDEAEEAYDPPEPDVNAPIALRIEPRAAASLIARMANHIAGCDWHGNPFDDGEQGCYHGKIYDADIGEHVPCPTCRRSTEQALGDIQK